ncbi:MAG: ribonuclease P protein component [Spirosomataceae bacterium]
MKHTFPKSERLSSKKIIDSLFDRGSDKTLGVFLYPFRVSCLIQEPDQQAATPAILISVSKRYFKHAVDRNLIKRRIREAYRLQKHLLLEKPNKPLPSSIAFVYIAKKIEDYAKIEKSMKGVLQKMAH